jgi:hypothetical protein
MDQTYGTMASSRGTDSPHFRRTTRCAPVIGIAVLLACAGCHRGGLDRNAIGGSVTLDGKALATGGILFSPIKGTRGPVTGGAIENGRYQLPRASGPVAGWYRVEIHATRKTGKMVPAPFRHPGENEMIEEQEEAVAPRFNFESTLEVEVKPGENAADFSVSSR